MDLIAYAVFYAGIVAIALSIIYLLDSKSQVKQTELTEKIAEVASRNLEMYKEIREFKSCHARLMAENEAYVADVIEAKQEVNKLQEHCARLRQGQINLQDKVSKRRPVLKMEGPIQVEIYSPKKNLGAKKSKPLLPK